MTPCNPQEPVNAEPRVASSPAKPLEIVMLSTGLSRGGAEHQLVQLAERLAARGQRVGVVSMLPPAAFVDRLAVAGIPVETLGMRRGLPELRAYLRLVRLLRRWRPRVLHSHMVHANLLGRLVRLAYRVPVQVSTAQNAIEGGRWVERAYRLTDFLTDLTTNVSRAAVARFVEVGAVPADRIRYVPNTADLEVYRPDPEARARTRAALAVGDAFVWLAVGRFEPQKDYSTLLRAFASVGGSARLVLAGQGEMRGEAEAFAADLGVANRVSFLGLRDDVPALMNAADCFVLSSAFEGLPLVLVEAAATGLPIVTTDAGGAAEVIGGAEPDGGLVVPVRDPDALASAMNRLAALPAAARKAMGTANHARAAREYGADAVVDVWEGIYAELLDRQQDR